MKTRFRLPLRACLVLATFLHILALAQPSPSVPSNQIKPNQASSPTPAPPPPSPLPSPPLQRLTDTTFQIGAVVLDKSAKTVQFPAAINLDSGLIEYLLVTTNGKAYESLLATTAQPYHIHLAMLLIGAKGTADTPALQAVPTAPFHLNRPPGDTNPPPPAITGDPFTIELSWSNATTLVRRSAESCLLNLQTKTNAAPGPWTYNGSRVVKGVFLPQRDGSIVAIIDDIDAMANNPRPGHDNDQLWQINSNALPPLHTPVTVTFKLQNTP